MPLEQQEQSLLRFGVVYSLKYLGNIEILYSMRSLKFEERRNVTRECIKKVANNASGRVVPNTTQFNEYIANRIIAREPDLFLSGIDVLLTISVEFLKVARKDTRQVIMTHNMELVSFASGGEGENIDCIAYIAKDSNFKRVCYVFESVTGLASHIISTIGQAFDLKYNDSMKQDLMHPENQPPKRIEIETPLEKPTDLHMNNSGVIQTPVPVKPTPFPENKKKNITENLENEEWFHKNISRAETEALLKKNGDFLVRECSHIPGQYVLSGRYNNQMRHLLLVDPNGVVRTRGYTFDSISHLIYYHQQKKISIISPDSELLLVNPVVREKR